MKNLLEIFRKIIIGFFILIACYVVFINVVNIFKLGKYFVFLLTLIVVFAIYFLSNIKKEVQNKKINYIINIGSIFIFTIILVYVGFKTRVDSTWDYSVILGEVHKYINGLDVRMHYFARYPNNIALFLFQIFLAKLGCLYNPQISVMGIQSITIIVNAFIIVFSIYLLKMIAKKVINRRAANIVFVLSILYSPLYLYTTIMYTDTIGMLLNVISLFLFYISLNVSNKKGKWLSNVFLALAIAIGFKFKATNIFILIAIVMQFFYDRKFKDICILVVLSIFCILGIGSLIDKSYPISEEMMDKNNFPYTHWLMMSLNPKTSGGYILEDVVYSMSFDTLAERKEGILKKLEDRIDDYSVSELLNRIFVVKVSHTWTNPTLGSEDYLQRNPYEWNYINKTVTYGHKNFKYYYVYIYSIYLFILIGVVLSGVFNFKDKNIFIFISQIVIIGIFCFELIWETHSRYVYTFLPFMILCASYGYALLYEKFFRRGLYEK